MKKSIFLSILILSLFMIGCTVQKSATTPDARSATDSKAKSLTVPAGKALVYIVRPGALGLPINFKVKCNNKELGFTTGKKFIYTIQDPGKHMISSKAENTAELEVQLEAGKVYYIEQVVQMGVIKARNKLALLNEGEGKEKLDKCKLSNDCVEK